MRDAIVNLVRAIGFFILAQVAMLALVAPFVLIYDAAGVSGLLWAWMALSLIVVWRRTPSPSG